jgi:SAM-dependent methyltransferase
VTKVFDSYAAYYDLLYEDKDYVSEAAYCLALLAEHGVDDGSILELGCGTGKHAEEFARRGFSVHGIDLSELMVELAEQRKPTELADRLRFEVGDVRDARLGRQFDAVISLFHVASYQTSNQELKAMFSTAAEHLKPGGVFVFDFWYGPAVLTEQPEVRNKRMKNEEIEVLRVAEPVMHPNENVVDVKYTINVTHRDVEKPSVITETHRMRYLFLPELEDMLMNANLELVKSAKWLTEEMLDLSSWQGLAVCRKV